MLQYHGDFECWLCVCAACNPDWQHRGCSSSLCCSDVVLPVRDRERERRTWRGGDLERSAHSSHPSILPEQRCVIGRHRSPLCGLKDILTTAGMMDFLLLTAALSVSSGASAASLCEYSCGSTRSLLFLLLSQSDVEPAGLTLCLWGTATSHRMKVSLSYLLLLSLFHTVTFMEDFQSESDGKQPSAFS